jgi:hypothetical protein
MEWKNVGTELPKPGTKLIALYNDGSGALLMMRDDHGEYVCAEGEAENLSAERFNRWAVVPDDHALWFETHEPE